MLLGKASISFQIKVGPGLSPSYANKKEGVSLRLCQKNLCKYKHNAQNCWEDMNYISATAKFQ